MSKGGSYINKNSYATTIKAVEYININQKMSINYNII